MSALLYYLLILFLLNLETVCISGWLSRSHSNAIQGLYKDLTLQLVFCALSSPLAPEIHGCPLISEVTWPNPTRKDMPELHNFTAEMQDGTVSTEPVSAVSYPYQVHGVGKTDKDFCAKKNV